MTSAVKHFCVEYIVIPFGLGTCRDRADGFYEHFPAEKFKEVCHGNDEAKH